MPDWKIHKARPVVAELSVPGDKSISHRSIMLAALANGTARITGFLPSEDCLATMKAFQQLGVGITRKDETTVVIEGRRGKFTAPKGDIDCGNSGTTMRLLCGILAAQPFRSRLTGDASLSKRPMKRVIDPLTQMGAKITAEGEKGSAPLVIVNGPIVQELGLNAGHNAFGPGTKSNATIGRALLKLYPATAGEVLFEGRDVLLVEDVIDSGRTASSNCSAVRKPSSRAASRRVVPSLWAFLATWAERS